MASSPETRAAETDKSSEMKTTSESISRSSGASASPSSDRDADNKLSDTETPKEPKDKKGKSPRSKLDADQDADKNGDKNGKPDDAHDDASDAPPPLPDEPLPDEAHGDDGWDPMWSEEHNAWYFFNRFTQQTQWENPRVSTADGSGSKGAADTAGVATIGGYNPAIHGDYDPNAWYARGSGAADDNAEDEDASVATALAAFQQQQQKLQAEDGDIDPNGAHHNRHSHEAKAHRQMNAYFDVDAAASAHDGRSLKAERSGKKPTRSELKAFKEKRRVRKEEKRRAWLRD